MGIMIKPTKDRNGTYYIRKAVPQELRPAIGKGELKLSLKTKDLGQAKLKAPAALAKINSIIQNARAERTVTQDDTEVIASVWMTRILQQPELIKARYVQEYDEGYGLTADNGQLSVCLRKGERADEADFRLVTQLMQSELEEALRWTPAILTPAWRQKLAWRLAEHRLSTAEMYILDELPSYAAITATQKQKSLTFTALFEHYKAHIRLTDKDRAESRIRDYTSSANRFIKFIGDKPIRDISKTDLSAFRTLMEQAPANRSKAVNSLSLENQAKAQGKKLSASTVRNIFMHLSAMFRVALEDDLLDEHPFDSFKMRKKVQAMNEHTPFTDEEIRTMFRLPLFHGEQSLYGEMAYWIPIILYYTGARVEEIGQLRRADIEVAYGVPCFKIQMGEEQSVKTAGSVRYVPIHSHILELGFMDFVNTREGQLFAEKSVVNDKYAYNYGRWWGRLIRKHGIRKEVKPSHSFRHYFITQCRALDVREDTQNNILGHVPGSVPRRYGSYLIETSRVLIERIPRLELKRLEN
ncbi:site-specific integrase [Klebsiella pneumoniae]|uniref:site-specific integrase n=2 Tax=Bacteria TaxID=2 RepID=UPI0023811F91|nr:site-specific integrase [Klebsiella pneumoniae]MDE4608601.1 site-specific integrase [Klebsiella pneumoniae]HDH0489735.1 site-specific integrase [Klebsiella pneumoniae]HDH0504734.1 site-specific integrase [Klebsiella pneumoniae]